MKRKILLCLVILLVCVLPGGTAGFAAAADDGLRAAVTDAGDYIYRAVPAPQIASIGGEWAVIGLSRSGADVPASYYETYYRTVEKYVKEQNGVLSENKYTEYSRVILALTAIGKDPRNVSGHNLLLPLADFNATVWQGINGPVWALIAFDSGGYDIPQNPQAAVQATRDLYLQEILSRQLPDGGFSLSASGTAADPDITGMVLQALAAYQGRNEVKEATEKALDCLSTMQNDQGGFNSWNVDNLESTVQVLVALNALDISESDARFTKNGHTVLDYVMTFYRKGAGFVHDSSGGGSNQMASEQGFYGLVSALRAREGQPALYQMQDVTKTETRTQTETPANAAGLPGKNAAVTAQPVQNSGKTFADLSGAASHPNKDAIEALAARGIVTGRSDTVFGPNETMTRAEYAAIVVRALGLTPMEQAGFVDVPSGSWFAPYVGTSGRYGIVRGVSETQFSPSGTITRQEAAVMTARAAALCGLDPAMEDAAVRDALAQFADYVGIADWARASMAFCYAEGILDDSALEVRPVEAIQRAEIAQMLYNMLKKAALL